MTKAYLADFRTLRGRHLKYGIGKIGDRGRYLAMVSEVQAFVDSLENDAERAVMAEMYLHCRSASAAGMRLHYDESHIRRIRARVLARLE